MYEHISIFGCHFYKTYTLIRAIFAFLIRESILPVGVGERGRTSHSEKEFFPLRVAPYVFPVKVPL